MNLRPYQIEFIEKSLAAWQEEKNILGVAATGAGKTIIAADLMKRLAPARCLFMADAQELVKQNAEKFYNYTGEFAGVDMAESHADPAHDRVVIATAQSLARRLAKYSTRHFDYIIIDEAHRNTLGDLPQSVLAHFASAKVLGVTATPHRADRKKLGDFYTKIAVEIALDRLIREGYLASIKIKSVPLNIDLRSVRTQAGDFKLEDLQRVMNPELMKAARLLAEHAGTRRKIVSFLPLVSMAEEFANCCNELGLESVAVSGMDRSELEKFTGGSARNICNAQLLTTGWDCPAVDCVYVLRPTKSLSLYQQMVGRGTRVFPGKENLLLLDPLYLSDDHRLITPARLIATSDEDARALETQIAAIQGMEGGDGEADLLGAETDVKAQREESLRARVEKNRNRSAREVDAMEFALSLHEAEIAEYTPEMPWEEKPISDGQRNALIKAGFAIESISCRGHASRILDILFSRRERGLATPKQVKHLKRMGHPSPETASFEEAGAFLDRVWSRGRAA